MLFFSPKHMMQENIFVVVKTYIINVRECVSMGAAGAQTRRSLGHHLLHQLIQIPNAFPE